MQTDGCFSMDGGSPMYRGTEKVLCLMLLLAALVLISATAMSVSVSAEDDPEIGTQFYVDDVQYEITELDAVKTIGLKNPASYKGPLDIPSSVQYMEHDYTVTAIGDRSFMSTPVSSVTIPNTVTSIGFRAFSGCGAMSSFVITENVVSIGDYAFSGCASLTSISMPESIRSIGDYAFYNCTSLVSASMSENTESIGDYAFNNCTSLTSAEIPDSVLSLGEGAFNSCSSLDSVVIGNSVPSIGKRTFQDCSKLTYVTIPNSVLSVGDHAFYNCTSLIWVQLGEGVASLNYSFLNCFHLIEVCNDSELTDEYIINEMSRVINIYSSTQGNSILQYEELGDSSTAVFFEKDSEVYLAAILNIGAVVSLPATLGGREYNLYNNAMIYEQGITSVSIGTGVRTIGEFAFGYCGSLNDLDLGSSVTVIKWAAFTSCTSLVTVSIPASVTELSGGAFGSCSSLTDINVSEENEHYASVEGVLFTKDMEELLEYPIGKDTETYSVPEGVKSIHQAAFNNCTKLKSVRMPEGFKNIWLNAFQYCTSLVSVEFPSTIRNVSYYAFYHCTSLVNVSINPTGDLYVQEHAFGDCTSLTSAEISGISFIDNYVFSGCTSLVSVRCDGNIRYIGDYAFYNCTSLLTFDIPENVTRVGEKAFANCTSLKAITIPDGLTNIADDAFIGITFYEGNGTVKITNYSQLHGFLYAGDSAEKLVRICFVHFDENGGPVKIEPMRVVPGDDFVIPVYEGTRTGYTLKGWSYDTQIYREGDSVVMIEGNMLFTAVWDINYYTISFDSNGGSPVPSKTQEYGSVVTEPNPPTRTGYTFIVWQHNGLDYEFTTMPAENVSLIALWKANIYTITFMNGEDVFSTSQREYDSFIIAPKEKPTKESTVDKVFTFTEWDGYIKGMTVTGDRVFDAVYLVTVREYTISFISDGSVYQSDSIGYGSLIIRPQNDPVKPSTAKYDYTFVEWQNYYEGITVTGEQSFHAVFYSTVRSYGISFMSDGNVYKYDVLLYGTTITKPDTIPEKEPTPKGDYVFSYWDGYTEGMTVTGNREFEAVFKETLKKYTVSFVSEGETVKSEVLYYGSTIYKPVNDPVKKSTEGVDYKFIGWDGYTEGMTVTCDQTFNAIFQEIVKQFRILFISDGNYVKDEILIYGTVIEKPAKDPEKPSTANNDFVFIEWTGYTEGMIAVEDETFVASYEAIIKNINTSGDKVIVETSEVDTVKSPSEITDRIIAAGEEGKSTEIRMSKGKIVLDGQSAAGLPSGDLSISFTDTDRTSIPEDLLKQIGDRPVYSIRIGDVHEFDGTLTISVKYILKEGEDPSNVCIWYLKTDDGTYQKITCEYSGGFATFKTNHLSDYAVMIDTAQPEPSSDEGSLNVAILIGALIIAIAVIVAVLYITVRTRY